MLLREGADLAAWLHPGVGPSSRPRVLTLKDEAWVAEPDVTLPDAWWASIETDFGLGDDGVTWVTFDGWAARSAP